LPLARQSRKPYARLAGACRTLFVSVLNLQSTFSVGQKARNTDAFDHDHSQHGKTACHAAKERGLTPICVQEKAKKGETAAPPI
jgi:hypothetical protein